MAISTFVRVLNAGQARAYAAAEDDLFDLLVDQLTWHDERLPRARGADWRRWQASFGQSWNWTPGTVSPSDSGLKNQ